MTLEEIEKALQARLEHMANMDDYPIGQWLETYRILAEVKQAQATERIVVQLEGIRQYLGEIAL